MDKQKNGQICDKATQLITESRWWVYRYSLQNSSKFSVCMKITIIKCQRGGSKKQNVGSMENSKRSKKRTLSQTINAQWCENSSELLSYFSIFMGVGGCVTNRFIFSYYEAARSQIIKYSSKILYYIYLRIFLVIFHVNNTLMNMHK